MIDITSNSPFHPSRDVGRRPPPPSSDSSREPIAIVGLGCRFPGGASDPASYWRLLEGGIDAVTETPAERWNLQKFFVPGQPRPGKTQSKWGGYIDRIDAFDPQLFGISPREAASMDPQQRMLLEVAFRAIEDAGQPLPGVAGERVSVFVGISSIDYAVAGLSFADRGVIDAYSNTGASASIAANRISYCFDLRGPSVAVDTACSSSLVAVHMACESLWRGEAKLALAGGVNALLMPDFYVAFSQLGVLSPTGRCKTFDSRADGYVRSEGAGMVFLKPLRAALCDRDAIYAVIRSTALNQDGRTPGMTVPSGAAQQELIREALHKAALTPADIQYVEAHGTGTAVGDPIEARAIGTALSSHRTDATPCYIGSVKTNLGHLEAGAGIASLIKVALALHHRQIPAHLHFQKANPAIDFAALKLRIPVQTCPWQSDGSPRRAGINGFGYGGANAHVILEEAPLEAADYWQSEPPVSVGMHASTCDSTGDSTKPERNLTRKPRITGAAVSKRGEQTSFGAPVVLPLSARTQRALKEQMRQLADWLQQHSDTLPLAELAAFLAHRRSHFEIRGAVCAEDVPQAIDQLRSLADRDQADETLRLSSSQLTQGCVFVCSGQGPQWWGMGRGLLKYSPTFRATIKRCDAQFAKYATWSLMEELSRDEADSRMQKTSIAQPSIFAIQVGLAAVWESWGVKPAVVVGHSVGEIAAAYISGGLSWEDACCVAFHRGRTMDLASSQGAMLAAGLAANEVPAWLEGIESDVSLAAINGPTSVTISGASRAIEQLAQRLETAGVFCRRLAVEYAFHSPQMEPVCDELLKALAHIRPRSTTRSMISTVTGNEIDGMELNPDYWWRNVRQSVRFSQAMTSLAERGIALAIEVGPHPVLAYSINECFQAAGRAVHVLPSLNRKIDDLQCISKSLAGLYTAGADVNWSGYYRRPVRKLLVPSYPLQLQHCWSESIESRLSRQAVELHPLLGEVLATPTAQWRQRVDLKLQSFLADHRVRGACIYPAAAVIETALAAARQVTDTSDIRLQRLQLHSPCALDESGAQCVQSEYDSRLRRLQLVYRPTQDASRQETSDSAEEWKRLATVRVSTATTTYVQRLGHDASSRLAKLQKSLPEDFDQQQLYEYCASIGLQYGPGFQGVLQGKRRDGEAIVEISIPPLVEQTDYQRDEYLFHPTLLDSCFHAMIAADYNFDHTIDGLYLPAEIREIVFFRSPAERVTAHVRVTHKSKTQLHCDLDIYDGLGQLCLVIRGFESKRVAGGDAPETTEELIYGFAWQAAMLDSRQHAETTPELTAGSAPSHSIVFMDESGLGRQLCQQLEGQGGRVVRISRAAAENDADYSADPEDCESVHRALAAAVQDLDGLVTRVVYLWGLDLPSNDSLDAESLARSTLLTTLGPMHVVQAWERFQPAPAAELAVVTAGGQSPENVRQPVNTAAGPLIGFGRVINNEYAALPTRLIDISVPQEHAGEYCKAEVQMLLAELTRGDDEDEIMLRSGQRFVRRFRPQAGQPLTADAARLLPSRMNVGTTAGIEELHYVAAPAQPLPSGHVELEVMATGLNFSDVMKSLGLYPGLPDGPVALGAECSGRISRVGANSAWQVGDEVIAIAPGAFGTHVCVPEDLVARKPASLTHIEAAAVPIAFLTAHYALHECARLQAGESLLIHSASGGVGLAAMQLAKLAGVQILATAGTEEKRQYVRDQGVSCVMDSRTLAFGDQTREATQGQGVDAVLNSLPGEAIQTGLSALRTGGRFLEIGKRDIYDDAPLGLYTFRNNLALFAIDLDQLFKQEPQKMGDMLRQLAARFDSGELLPLPVRTFKADEVRAAFRFMQQGKHVGKVVVDYSQRPAQITAGAIPPIAFDASSTYWIAGGLGGFGLQLARWMADHGARHLVLSGRSRQLSPAADETLQELERAGVRVAVEPADITLPSEIERVLQWIDAELPPLRGVFHTAMVLEDRLLVDLDRATLERVLRPKVLGGWNLHQYTQDRELEHFVLFSSLSSVFGHAGQANYAAANAFLDSLAHARRAQGLSATVINWGHLGEVGYLAEREQLGQRLERQGVLSFSVQQAMNALEYALQTKALQLSVLRMDWSVWRGLGITDRVSPKFASLLRDAPHSRTTTADYPATSANLRAVQGQQRTALVDQLLRSKTSALLGLPVEQIPADKALLELGLDSLMAVELRNWIESHIEINLPISTLMRSSCFAELVGTICEAIESNPIGHEAGIPHDSSTEAPLQSAASLTQQEAQSLLEQLPDLDDESVNQLLVQMLREQQ